MEASERAQAENEEYHKEEKKRLEDKIQTMSKKLAETQAKFDKAEGTLLKNFQTAENALMEKLGDYDTDMAEKNEDLSKMQENYKKVQDELNMVQDIYNGLLEEKARKEEEEAKIREREEARAAEMKHLNKAAEWVQAHWKGLMTRKDKGLKKALTRIKKKKKKARKKAALLAAKAGKA